MTDWLAAALLSEPPVFNTYVGENAKDDFFGIHMPWHCDLKKGDLNKGHAIMENGGDGGSKGKPMSNPLKRAHVSEADDPAEIRARRGPSSSRVSDPAKPAGERNKRKEPVSRKFTRTEKVRPLESFWTDAGDKVLILGDRDAKTSQCQLLTKKQHQKEFGPRSKEAYMKVPMLYKSVVDENNYISRRNFYEEDREGFNRHMDGFGLPRAGPYAPVDQHGIASYPHMIAVGHDLRGEAVSVGEWYKSDVSADQRMQLNEFGERYGKENLRVRMQGLVFKKLDMLSRSDNWSAAADLMVMEGWPRVAVRNGNDRYTDVRAHYSMQAPEDVLILSRSGDGYYSPRDLKNVDENYVAMMREVGLHADIAEHSARPGPDKLLCNGHYELLSGDAYDEAADNFSDNSKLVLARSEGEVIGHYSRLSKVALVRTQAIEKHESHGDMKWANDLQKFEEESENSSSPPMTAIRGLHPRAREGNAR